MQLKGVWNKLFLFVFLVLVAALCFSSISAAQIPSAWDCLSTWDNPIWKNQFNTWDNPIWKNQFNTYEERVAERQTEI